MRTASRSATASRRSWSQQVSQPSVIGYNPRRVTFTGTAQEVVALQPDLSILVTYEEGANLLSALVTAGVDPADDDRPRRVLPAADRRPGDGRNRRPTQSTVSRALGSMGNKAFLERLYEDDSNGQVANAAQAVRLRHHAVARHRHG